MQAIRVEVAAQTIAAWVSTSPPPASDGAAFPPDLADRSAGIDAAFHCWCLDSGAAGVKSLPTGVGALSQFEGFREGVRVLAAVRQHNDIGRGHRVF